MCALISLEVKKKVREMLPTHSASEIATELGISQRSVFNIQQEWNVKRTPEQLKVIRSRVRRKIIQAEKRRVIFGQDQKTGLKVFSNKRRHSLKFRLKRVGYKNSELTNTLLYDSDTKRNSEYERIAKALGLTIKPA